MSVRHDVNPQIIVGVAALNEIGFLKDFHFSVHVRHRLYCANALLV